MTSELKIKNLISCEENSIYQHFQNIKNIKGLILLYQASQLECSRAGKLNPEIGSSRERDLVASFANNKELIVDYDIPNGNEEDVNINNIKLSIKHSSNKENTPGSIKINWTTNADLTENFVNNFVFRHDLIIVYVRLDKTNVTGTIEIIYINSYELIHQQNNCKANGEKVFKILGGASKGIQFDVEFFKKIINNLLFHVYVEFKNFTCDGCDSISKRIKLLNSIQ